MYTMRCRYSAKRLLNDVLSVSNYHSKARCFVISPRPFTYAHLIKPVRQTDLAEALRHFGKPVKHVLIVDDNPNILQLFTRMLSIVDRTLEITAAANGTETLAELRQLTQAGTPPDLVLLDILLPDMMGWQVLEEKNQDPTICDIPVIVVSGEELVAWPTHSPVLLATMGAGLSVNKLLHCSRELSTLLMKPDGELDVSENEF